MNTQKTSEHLRVNRLGYIAIIIGLIALVECDILLTHTGIIDGMSVKNDFIDSYASTDENLISDIKEERKLVQKLQIASGCSKHYFGHFHQRWSGEQFGVDARCLDICEVVHVG